eukprot:14821918-Heterocapsa_arctica.AAC.1
MCEQLMCNSCEQCRDGFDDEGNGHCDSPVVFRHHSFDPHTELPVSGHQSQKTYQGRDLSNLSYVH